MWWSCRRWGGLCVLVTVYYVLKYSGDCSVVMPWWAVGEGNVVISKCPVLLQSLWNSRSLVLGKFVERRKIWAYFWSSKISLKVKVRNSSSRSSKVIDLGANRKRIYTFLLATHINFGRVFYRLCDIDAFSSKIACFPHPALVWRPIAGERPATSMQLIHRWKVHVMGYNSVADNTDLSSFV